MKDLYANIIGMPLTPPSFAGARGGERSGAEMLKSPVSAPILNTAGLVLLLLVLEDGFDRYGGWLIVFARFFDGTRQLNGIAAGILAMPWARFTLYTLAGAALWVCFWGLGAYYLDLHLDQVVAFIRLINPWVAIITLTGLGVLAALLWHRSSLRRKGTP